MSDVDAKRAPEDDVEMGIIGHFGELRKRLMRGILGLFPGIFVGWFLREELLATLIAPFSQAWRLTDLSEEPKLVFLNPIDPFVAYLKIAVIAGVLVGAPWLFLQLWAFIAPGLYRKERRLAVPFVLVSTLFFLVGIAFAYFVVFPMAFQYFLEFAVVLPGGVRIEPTIAISEILTFEVRLLLAFGVVFELPVVITFLAAAGIVNWRQLLKFGRWWVVIAAILSAFLTPPDVASQLMMLGPLVFLYYLSVVFAFLVSRKRTT